MYYATTVNQVLIVKYVIVISPFMYHLLSIITEWSVTKFRLSDYFSHKIYTC